MTRGRSATAAHCFELTARARSTRAPESRLADIAPDLAKGFAARLGSLLGAARLRAACSPAELLDGEVLREKVGTLATTAVLSAGASGAQVLVSIGPRDMLALTDRFFGGEGEVPEELPGELPLTADLVAGQVIDLVGESLAAALSLCAPLRKEARATDLARLDAFAASEQFYTFAIEVAQADGASWTFLLALSPKSFAALFCAQPAKPSARSPSEAGSRPFADIPLELGAVAAEFTMPLTRLTGLKPGDTIPLSLSREVPLKILETTIAYGTLGAADERVALQLTRVF